MIGKFRGAFWYFLPRALTLLCFHFFIGLSVPSFASNPERLDQIAQIFQDNDYQIPSEQCLTHILNLEKQNQKQFSEEEVIWAAEGFLDLFGEELHKRKHCFTCKMRVLTPDGYREIGKLQVGDGVYSWHEERKQFVLNTVAAVHDSGAQRYGKLGNTPTGVDLEVTSSHKFYVPELRTYTEIGHLDNRRKLRAIDAETCTGYLQPRGEYNFNGVASVRTITVRNPPHNFVIEGFVAHNKPIF